VEGYLDNNKVTQGLDIFGLFGNGNDLFEITSVFRKRPSFL